MAKSVRDEAPNRLREAQPESQLGIARRLAEPERFHDPIQRGDVAFEAEVQRLPRRGCPAFLEYLQQTPLAYVLAAPLIYGMIIPLLILDASATLFQQVCFRIWGIPRLRRLDYLVIDRHRLAYLNAFERLNCVYCGYATQLIEYAREINARTEQFFCPIKHARRTLDPHRRTQRFFDYGDARAYVQDLDTRREDWDE
jgi:hypothetical protein